jgi:hypothetical protein
MEILLALLRGGHLVPCATIFLLVTVFKRHGFFNTRGEWRALRWMLFPNGIVIGWRHLERWLQLETASNVGILFTRERIPKALGHSLVVASMVAAPSTGNGNLRDACDGRPWHAC